MFSASTAYFLPSLTPPSIYAVEGSAVSFAAVTTILRRVNDGEFGYRHYASKVTVFAEELGNKGVRVVRTFSRSREFDSDDRLRDYLEGKNPL